MANAARDVQFLNASTEESSMRCWIVALSFAALATPIHAQAPARPVLVARLDSLSRDFLVSAPAAGATVAVIKGSDTLLFAGCADWSSRSRTVESATQNALHRPPIPQYRRS